MEWLKFMLMMSISVGMLVMVGCGDDSNPVKPADELIGRWSVSTSAGFTEYLEFKEDDVLLMSFANAKGNSVVFPGTWSVEDRILTTDIPEGAKYLENDSGKSILIRAGARQQGPYSIANGKLIFQYSEGKSITFERASSSQ